MKVPLTAKTFSQVQSKLDELLELEHGTITLAIRGPSRGPILADVSLQIDAPNTNVSLIFEPPRLASGHDVKAASQVPVVCMESEEGGFFAINVT